MKTPFRSVNAPLFIFLASFLLATSVEGSHEIEESIDQSSPRLSLKSGYIDSWSSSSDEEMSVKARSSGASLKHPPLSDSRSSALTLDLERLITPETAAPKKGAETLNQENKATRALSARLIMPMKAITPAPVKETSLQMSLTLLQFKEAEDSNDDIFDDIADDLELKLNLMSLKNIEEKAIPVVTLADENPDRLSLDKSFVTSHSMEPSDLLRSKIQNELARASGNQLMKMIEICRNTDNPIDLRICYGRQSIMCLMVDNTFSRAFAENKEKTMVELIVLLSNLKDPYATLRFAEYKLKNPHSTSMPFDALNDFIDEAYSMFTLSLTYFLEQFNPEDEHLYFFNSLRTIVTESAITSHSLELGFYPLLTKFLAFVEISNSAHKEKLGKEIKEVISFCETHFKATQLDLHS